MQTDPSEPTAPVGTDELLCLLDAQGMRHRDVWLNDHLPPLDLRAVYSAMSMSRRIDAEAIALQRQGELGLWPSLLGQEGAQVGAASGVRGQDIHFPTYREHAVAYCRGVNIVGVLGLFRGTSLGGWDPRETGFQLYTLVIGAQTLHAVGYALGLTRSGRTVSGNSEQDACVIAYLGDGALSEGETNEALAWAAAYELPVVFFCQNNQWAISTPFSTQSKTPAVQRATGFGIPSIRVDGNDVLACASAMRFASDRARTGGGPMFIEAVTYRRNPHTTSDDDGRYRPAALTTQWEARDPLARLRTHLLTEGVLTEADLAAAHDAEEAMAAGLRTGVRSIPNPSVRDPFDNTFEAATPELQEQRDDLSRFAQLLADLS